MRLSARAGGSPFPASTPSRRASRPGMPLVRNLFVMWDDLRLVAKRIEHGPHSDPPGAAARSLNPYSTATNAPPRRSASLTVPVRLVRPQAGRSATRSASTGLFLQTRADSPLLLPRHNASCAASPVHERGPRREPPRSTAYTEPSHRRWSRRRARRPIPRPARSGCCGRSRPRHPAFRPRASPCTPPRRRRTRC